MKKYYACLILFISFNAFSQSQVSLEFNSVTSVCSPGDCADVNAVYPDIKETTSYRVQSIPYNPLVPFSGGNVLTNSADDNWSYLMDLPFNFCFYGNFYNQIIIGTNGVIHFPDGSQPNPNNLPWSFNTAIPSVAFPVKNAIYGVYQDTNLNAPPVTSPSVQNINYYIFGTAPNRIFAINFSEMPLFGCGSSAGLQTTQVILYETSNKIDVYVKNRSACTSWNSGYGVLGIQNSEGTNAVVPPGRNTGAWNAVNEAWRFVPDGNSASSIQWNINGTPVAGSLNVNPLNVCPADGDVIQATVTYSGCAGVQRVLSKSIVLNHDQSMSGLADVSDLSGCSVNSNPVVFDLTQNTLAVLNGMNPDDFFIEYFSTYNIADQIFVPILNPQSFSSTGQTVFLQVEGIATGCIKVKEFDLIVNPNPQAPTGNNLQYFVNGETLADIEITGTNIQWYGSATGNDSLPITTLLVNNVTYYASQTNMNCESRLSTPERLAVTVEQSLNDDNFDLKSLKIYPNPVKDVFRISYVKEISSISVHNLLGQEIVNQKVNSFSSEINLSTLSRGTYLVKITVDGLIKTLKVIKE